MSLSKPDRFQEKKLKISQKFRHHFFARFVGTFLPWLDGGREPLELFAPENRPLERPDAVNGCFVIRFGGGVLY